MIRLELLEKVIKIPQNRLIFQNFNINFFEYIDIVSKKYICIFNLQLIIMKSKIKY